MKQSSIFNLSPKTSVQSIVDSVLNPAKFSQPNTHESTQLNTLPNDAKLNTMKDYLTKRGAVT